MSLVFNNNNVTQKNVSQKHLGVILDFKLKFEDHLSKIIGPSHKLITKGNSNYYIQSFHSAIS